LILMVIKCWTVSMPAPTTPPNMLIVESVAAIFLMLTLMETQRPTVKKSVTQIQTSLLPVFAAVVCLISTMTVI
jgi:hypothetical protein